MLGEAAVAELTRRRNDRSPPAACPPVADADQGALWTGDRMPQPHHSQQESGLRRLDRGPGTKGGVIA